MLFIHYRTVVVCNILNIPDSPIEIVQGKGVKRTGRCDLTVGYESFKVLQATGFVHN